MVFLSCVEVWEVLWENIVVWMKKVGLMTRSSEKESWKDRKKFKSPTNLL